MMQVDLAYIAGLIDGEGNMQITSVKVNGKPYFRFDLRVFNTKRSVLEWCKKTLGVGQVYRDSRTISGKFVYQWKASTAQARDVLSMVLPYLKIKRKEALIVLSLKFNFPGQKLSRQQIKARQVARVKLMRLHNRGKKNW